jgi:hypothetical protein
MPGITVTVKSTDLTRLSKQMRTLGNAKAMRARLTKGLRKGAGPAQASARQTVVGLPSHGRKHSGWRRRAAAATSIQIRTSGKDAGVYVRIRRSALGAQAPLPRVTNTGRWRHRVYGSNQWVTQTSRRGWWDQAMKSKQGQVRAAVKSTINDLEREAGHR